MSPSRQFLAGHECMTGWRSLLCKLDLAIPHRASNEYCKGCRSAYCHELEPCTVAPDGLRLICWLHDHAYDVALSRVDAVVAGLWWRIRDFIRDFVLRCYRAVKRRS